MSELWYRFNVFAERQFFEKKNLIDGLIVPAHVVAYYEISFPEFLRESNLPFLIDPVSYVWDIEKRFITNDYGELKKSYGKLVEKLDCKVGRYLGQYRIRDVAITEPDFQEFVSKVLNFQLLDSGLKKPTRVQSIERLKERIRMIQGESPVEVEKRRAQPYALIPPYFFFRNLTEDGYQKTLYAAQFAKSSDFGKGYKIFPCLCIDRALLHDEKQLGKIVADFKDFSGIILWVSGFEEENASMGELRNLAVFVHSLSQQGSEVVNFYGGYFSLLLKYAGLSKMSSGICYSSSKNVFSEVSGGGLPIRYYEPSLKIKIPREAMFKLYLEKSELFSCECPTCLEYANRCKEIQTDRSAERANLLSQFFIEDKKRGIPCVIDWETSRLHFLSCRKTEQASIMKTPIAETAKALNSHCERIEHSGIDSFKYEYVTFEHLRRWAETLQLLVRF